MDVDGTYIQMWDEAAKQLSEACHFRVTPEMCYTWVKGQA